MGTNTTSRVPVVDISPFTSGGDHEARESAAKDLLTKGRVNGCIGLSGHGIPSAQLAQAFAVTKSLFDLPYEEKMEAPHPDAIVPHRGYSGTGREQVATKSALETGDETSKAAYSKTTDYKESYEIGSEENRVQYNIWLPEAVLPGFRDFATTFYWDLNRLAKSILDALIMSLDVTEKEARFIHAAHDGHDNQLRLLHYPPITAEMRHMQNLSRLGAHTDWSLFTLLFQDKNGGLEFLDRKSNNFIPAIPQEGVLYMNIGDMFQRFSNDTYPSALHRVVAKGDTATDGTKARFSIPYFVSARSDAIVEPPQSVIDACSERKYEPITFAEYSDRMFAAIYASESKT